MASPLDRGGAPTDQRVDVGKMFNDRHLVALSLVALVPLVVVVENQGDNVIEAVDKSIEAAELTRRWNRLSRSEKSW